MSQHPNVLQPSLIPVPHWYCGTRGIPDVRLSLWESGLAGQACGVLRKSVPCDFPLHEDDSHTSSGGCEMLLVQSKCHENCS